MKLSPKKSLLALLIVGITSPAFAAVDPAFTTGMTSIVTDVIAYMASAFPLIAGVFGFAIAVRFGVSLIKRLAK